MKTSTKSTTGTKISSTKSGAKKVAPAKAAPIRFSKNLLIKIIDALDFNDRVTIANVGKELKTLGVIQRGLPLTVAQKELVVAAVDKYQAARRKEEASYDPEKSGASDKGKKVLAVLAKSKVKAHQKAEAEAIKAVKERVKRGQIEKDKPVFFVAPTKTVDKKAVDKSVSSDHARTAMYLLAVGVIMNQTGESLSIVAGSSIRTKVGKLVAAELARRKMDQQSIKELVGQSRLAKDLAKMKSGK